MNRGALEHVQEPGEGDVRRFARLLSVEVVPREGSAVLEALAELLAGVWLNNWLARGSGRLEAAEAPGDDDPPGCQADTRGNVFTS